MNLTEKKECRACRTPLPEEDLFSLGTQDIVNYLNPGEENERGRAPLDLVMCRVCTLLQLRHTVDADTLFKTFYYRSGLNETMRKALADVAASVIKGTDLSPGDVVLDIGSNDGTGLSFYGDHLKRIGFDPAKSLVVEAREKYPNIEFVDDYFSKAKALEASGGKKYKVVQALAMFYDLDNPGAFLRDVFEVLDQEGLFVVQMNYLDLMLRNMSWDNISHEHLCYYSLRSLDALYSQNGFEIVDVELNDVNGGSFRVYAQRIQNGKKRMVNRRVQYMLHDELCAAEDVKAFGIKVALISAALQDFLVQLKLVGKKIYAYGASTRGATLLQTIFEDAKAGNVISGAAERDENKYGKVMAGLDIPIVPEEEARALADYMIVLPYHFWDSISKRERVWLASGKKFILPLPRPRVASIQEVCGSQAIVNDDLANELKKIITVECT